MAEFNLSWLDVGAIVTIISIGIGAMLAYVNGKFADQRTRVDALEKSSSSKIERIAKLEAFMENLKESNARLEAKLDQVLMAISKK